MDEKDEKIEAGHRSASHSQSFTSVFRTDTALMRRDSACLNGHFYCR